MWKVFWNCNTLLFVAVSDCLFPPPPPPPPDSAAEELYLGYPRTNPVNGRGEDLSPGPPDSQYPNPPSFSLPPPPPITPPVIRRFRLFACVYFGFSSPPCIVCLFFRCDNWFWVYGAESKKRSVVFQFWCSKTLVLHGTYPSIQRTVMQLTVNLGY